MNFLGCGNLILNQLRQSCKNVAQWKCITFSVLGAQLWHRSTDVLPNKSCILRPKAISTSIINSEGRVNIFNLAKNAGTSVDQIERFYARFLPLSKEMAKNLQSFGE